MLAGTQELGPSMFERLMPTITPSAEDLEAQRQAVLFNKTVQLSDVYVKTYDLAVPKDAKAYAKLLTAIFAGIQARTHVILFNERKFVTDKKPRWIAHIEWAEFELEVTANPSIRTKGEVDEGSF